MSISVEVRNSPVHGKGVFTTKDIKKGEFVCFYDGDLKAFLELIQISRDDGSIENRYWISHPRNPEIILCGYQTPHNNLGIGQLINDSKKLEMEENEFGMRNRKM